MSRAERISATSSRAPAKVTYWLQPQLAYSIRQPGLSRTFPDEQKPSLRAGLQYAGDGLHRILMALLKVEARHRAYQRLFRTDPKALANGPSAGRGEGKSIHIDAVENQLQSVGIDPVVLNQKLLVGLRHGNGVVQAEGHDPFDELFGPDAGPFSDGQLKIQVFGCQPPGHPAEIGRQDWNEATERYYSG